MAGISSRIRDMTPCKGCTEKADYCHGRLRMRWKRVKKMANEKRLIPFGEKCTLDELPCGTLFAFGDDCIAVKSEYILENGLIEAFIVDSGEQFWGGAKTAKEQNELMVQPLEIVEVDAVEVVHGHWVSLTECSNAGVYCSVCNKKVYKEDYAWCNRKNKLRSNYCPNCGAHMMDGGNEDV